MSSSARANVGWTGDPFGSVSHLNANPHTSRLVQANFVTSVSTLTVCIERFQAIVRACLL